jgi:carotenoid 1,2-hydratase
VDSSAITLTPPGSLLPRELLERQGAFLWWYADLLDLEGNGLVLIWAFGLPFLPGLRRATQRQEDARPSSWPALNLALYKRGRPAFYSLQRLPPASATWSDDEWTFGQTHIRRQRTDGRVRLEAALDVRLPSGERAVGSLRLEGPARRAAPSERAPEGLPLHDWSPLLGPAEGEASLSLSGEDFSLQGRAYHDRNGGVVPLWDLDIDRWLWGRVAIPKAELLYYLLWPKAPGEAPTALCLLIDEQGTTRSLPARVRVLGERATWTGSRLPKRIELDTAEGVFAVDFRHTLDNGPFYTRSLIEASLPDGRRGGGFGEGVFPARVDLPLHRPLVKMRVHELEAPSSFWLPLFSGRAQGRCSRLARQLLPRGAALEVKDVP